jgi:hypothetical protein
MRSEPRTRKIRPSKGAIDDPIQTGEAEPHSRKSKASPSNDALLISDLKSCPSRMGATDALDSGITDQ